MAFLGPMRWLSESAEFSDTAHLTGTLVLSALIAVDEGLKTGGPARLNGLECVTQLIGHLLTGHSL